MKRKKTIAGKIAGKFPKNPIKPVKKAHKKDVAEYIYKRRRSRSFFEFFFKILRVFVVKNNFLDVL
jgi:hypothetical protein